VAVHLWKSIAEPCSLESCVKGFNFGPGLTAGTAGFGVGGAYDVALAAISNAFDILLIGVDIEGLRMRVEQSRLK
jgi:hypothetical protein